MRKALSFIDRMPSAVERGRAHDGYDYGAWGIAYALVHLGGIVDRWPEGEKTPGVADLAARLTGVAKKLQRYLTDAATLSNVPDRARVHFKDQQIWLELRPVAKALVLLELHPGRFAGDRFTEPPIETLSDVCD